MDPTFEALVEESARSLVLLHRADPLLMPAIVHATELEIQNNPRMVLLKSTMLIVCQYFIEKYSDELAKKGM